MKRQIHTEVEPELAEQIQALANAMDSSFSRTVRVLLREAIERRNGASVRTSERSEG